MDENNRSSFGMERQGVVVRSTGSWMTVMDADKVRIECRIKGKFRLSGVKSTNPVAVGDRVNFIRGADGTGVITHIHPRTNYIVRKATRLSKRSHILAANVDQTVLIVTLAFPRTSTGFIDRFLTTSEAYHIPAALVFNKMDLYDPGLAALDQHLRSAYESAGYSCLGTSALTGENVEGFSRLLCGKVSLLAGHSGVGKSALVNAIEPSLNLKTASISDVHLKGKHTTTFAEMHPLSGGGYIIDTPGIKEFGLIDFNRGEVAERFPEMRALMHQCRFSNCTHVHEPGCAVKDAVADGRIALFRYENYLAILNDDYWDEPEDYDE